MRSGATYSCRRHQPWATIGRALAVQVCGRTPSAVAANPMSFSETSASVFVSRTVAPAILRSQRSPSHTWALDTASKQLRRTTATTSVQSNHSYRHRNQRRQRTWLVDAVDTPAPGRMFRAIRAAARAVTPTVVAVSIAPSSQFRPSARSVVATPLTFNDADGPRVDQTLVSPAGEMRRFAK